MKNTSILPTVKSKIRSKNVLLYVIYITISQKINDSLKKKKEKYFFLI